MAESLNVILQKTRTAQSLAWYNRIWDYLTRHFPYSLDGFGPFIIVYGKLMDSDSYSTVSLSSLVFVSSNNELATKVKALLGNQCVVLK